MRLALSLIPLLGLVSAHIPILQYKLEAYYNSKEHAESCEVPLPMAYDQVNDQIVRIVPGNQLNCGACHVNTNYNNLQIFSTDLDKINTELIGPVNCPINWVDFIAPRNAQAPVVAPPANADSSSSSSSSSTYYDDSEFEDFPVDFLDEKKVDEVERRVPESSSSSSSSSESSATVPCVDNTRIVTASENRLVLRTFSCLNKKCQLRTREPIIKAITAKNGYTYLLFCHELWVVNQHCRRMRKICQFNAPENYSAVDFIIDERVGAIVIGFEKVFVEVYSLKHINHLITSGYFFGEPFDGSYRLANSAQWLGRPAVWFNVLFECDIYYGFFNLRRHHHYDSSSSSSSSDDHHHGHHHGHHGHHHGHHHNSSSDYPSSSDCGCEKKANDNSPFIIAPYPKPPGKAVQQQADNCCYPNCGDEVVVFNDYENHFDIFVGMFEHPTKAIAAEANAAEADCHGCHNQHKMLNVFSGHVTRCDDMITQCQRVKLPCFVDGKIAIYSGVQHNNDLYISFAPSLDMVKLSYSTKNSH